MTAISNADITAKGLAVAEAANEAILRTGGVMALTMGLGMTKDFMEEVNGTIPGYYNEFNERDSSAIEPMIAELDATIAQLKDPVVEHMNSVKNYVDSWKGASADTFSENFLVPFPRVNANQIALALDLKKGMIACRDIIDQSRKSVMDIGDRSIEAFGQLKSPKSETNVLGIVLTVVGVVIATAGLFAGATAPTALTVLFSLMGSGVTLTNSISSATTTIAGGSPQEVLDSMIKAIQKLHEAVHEEEKVLAEALGKDVEEARRKMSELTLPRPRVADEGAANLDGFRLPEEVDPS